MFNEPSTGAQDDLQKATDIARRMVMEYGMSQCGQRTYSPERASFLPGAGGSFGSSREFSEATSEKIDDEIQRIMDDSYRRVFALVTAKKDMLHHIALILTDKETIEGKELAVLVETFGKTPVPIPVETEVVFPEVALAALPKSEESTPLLS